MWKYLESWDDPSKLLWYNSRQFRVELRGKNDTTLAWISVAALQQAEDWTEPLVEFLAHNGALEYLCDYWGI